jgi:hypothetical protein
VAGQVQGKNGQEPKKKKKKYSGQHKKEMDCDEPHLALNEKTQPIRWTERPTGALVAAGSHWTQSRSKPPIVLNTGKCNPSSQESDITCPKKKKQGSAINVE